MEYKWYNSGIKNIGDIPVEISGKNLVVLPLLSTEITMEIIGITTLLSLKSTVLSVV